MTRLPILIPILALTLTALCACDRAPRTATPPTVAAAPTPAPPKMMKPAKMMKMVCRSSRTGEAAECGSPGAVMVGMKPE